MIPYYLVNHLTEIKEKSDQVTGILSSTDGNTDLEIYYYGDLVQIRRTPYIMDSEYPCLIVAKDPLSGEEFVVFDGAKHGYDAMFCNEPPTDMSRELSLFEYAKGKFSVTFGYAIDYEDEKEYYTVNENNEVRLADGTYLDWDKVESIGYDWFSMKSAAKKKIIADIELA